MERQSLHREKRRRKQKSTVDPPTENYSCKYRNNSQTKKWKKIVFFCTTIYNNKVVGDCRSMIYTVFVLKLMYKCMYISNIKSNMIIMCNHITIHFLKQQTRPEIKCDSHNILFCQDTKLRKRVAEVKEVVVVVVASKALLNIQLLFDRQSSYMLYTRKKAYKP